MAEVRTVGLSPMRMRIARAERLLRRHPDDAERAREVDAARAEYAAAKLEQHIRAVVDSAPPLTDAQRARLSALLEDDDSDQVG